jgi:hypothetical protein
MTAKKPSAAKKTTTKSAKPKASTARDILVEVHSRGRDDLKASVRTRLEALEERDKKREEQVRKWLTGLEIVGRKLTAAKNTYRRSVYEVLANIYEKYLEIEASGELRNSFYHELRIKLLEAGYKLQKNTPDAGLLIRLVWGDNKLTAQKINQYVNALRAGQYNEIAVEVFADWLEKITITNAQKLLQSNNKDKEDELKERIRRARIFILKFLDWRETHPYLVGSLHVNKANQYVTPDTHLVVMLGTVVRQYDRASDYANIYVSHILPPNFEIDIAIIDKWAKYIEPQLERHEAEANDKPIEQWAAQFEDELWAFDVAEAEKQSISWALRQQASSYEDQQQFHKYAQAYKKERLKNTKAAKKAKK